MSEKVSPIPKGFVGVTPHIVVKGAAQAMAFYTKALGAEEILAVSVPGTEALMHAEMKVGGAHFMLMDENLEWGLQGPQSLNGSPVTLHLYVTDVDAAMAQAVAAGGEVTMPVANMFWGDRYGCFKDPFGHKWSLATHTSDPSPDEMQAAIAQMMTQG